MNNLSEITKNIFPPFSFYYANRNYDFPQDILATDLKCNICIIGGGLTGLTTALNLAKSGVKDIILIDAHQLGSGASGVNGGQLSIGYENSVNTLINKYGLESARYLWQLALDSVNDVYRNIISYNLKCNWVNGVGAACYHRSDFEELEQEYNILKTKFNYSNMDLYNSQETKKLIASNRYHGLLYDKTSAHINPLNYLLGIATVLRKNFASNVSIYVNSPVTRVEEDLQLEKINIKVSDKYTIIANKVIMAANFNAPQICSQLKSKVIAVRDIVLTTEQLPIETAQSLIPNNMAVFDTRHIMNYYRITEGNHLLFGGGAPQGNYNKNNALEALYGEMIGIFPQLSKVKVNYFWEGFEGTSINKLPHIGYNANKNIYYAQGFTGHGLNISNVAARVITEAINGNSYNIDAFKQFKHMSIPRQKSLQNIISKIGVVYFRFRDYLNSRF